MKIGVYSSMFGQDDPPQLESVESYLAWAYTLKLDVIDFHSGRGFQSKDPDYLLGVKMKCLQYGLSVGYLASGGHFVGSDEELEEKVEKAKEDADVAAFLGAPMIRLFCGQPLVDPEEQKREIRCFQAAADYAAGRGVVVGLQNHPSTGEDVLRILEETDRENFTLIMDTGQWVGSPARAAKVWSFSASLLSGSPSVPIRNASSSSDASAFVLPPSSLMRSSKSFAWAASRSCTMRSPPRRQSVSLVAIQAPKPAAAVASATR